MEHFKKDLVRKELLPIKVLMFLIYGGQATLYPYFTVHLKSLGVSIEHTAIIFAVQPVIALLVAPMVGMVADKIGNFKLIFSFFLTFSAVTANLLLLVPPVPQREKLLYFNLECDYSNRNKFELVQGKSCRINPETNDTYTNVTVKFQCQQICDEGNTTFYVPFHLKTEVTTNCSSQCGDAIHTGCTFVHQNASIDLSVKLQDFHYYNHSTSWLQQESYVINYENNLYRALECSCSDSRCNSTCTFVSQGTVENCENQPKCDEIGITFWSYLGIRLIVTLGIGLVNGLFDAASMAIIQELKADVGFQRVWSTVAMCMFAPISGFFVDRYDSFTPCFFMYGILYIVAAITSLKLDLSMKIPSENPLKNLILLLRSPEVILLLVQIAVLGICWGFLENFLFWFLQSELKSNNLIMGLTVTVGSGTGLFMALIATWCTRKLGYVNVIIVAFAAYTVRFFGYAFAQNAYICLIFEMMENFTVTLLTVGVTLYCTELASLEMLTTIMTLWNGLHIISGRAFGSLLGGFLVRQYGFRHTFMYFAYISAGFGSFYALMYITWLRKWKRASRKISEDHRRQSSVPEDKEDETMKHEAFSNLSMICSFDSPIILHYLPESPEAAVRRRAMSHIPVTSTNSFSKSGIKPRNAVSFSEGRSVQRPLSIIRELPQSAEEDIIQPQVEFRRDKEKPIAYRKKF